MLDPIVTKEKEGFYAENVLIIIKQLTLLHAHLVSPVFPWCYAHLSLASPSLKVGGFILPVVLPVLAASEALHGKEWDGHVNGFFFFALGSTWGHFYRFANVHFSFFIGLQLHVVSVFTIYGSFRFVRPKPSFAHLQVCISLTDTW